MYECMYDTCTLFVVGNVNDLLFIHLINDTQNEKKKVQNFYFKHNIHIVYYV